MAMPDWLVWKFWSGSDLALVSIPRQKSLYVSNENFFYKFKKNHRFIEVYRNIYYVTGKKYLFFANIATNYFFIPKIAKSCDFARHIASLQRSNVLTNRINCQKFLSKSLTAFFDAWKVEYFLSNACVEKFHVSLLSDLAQVWQRPDRLVWKFWSGSDLVLVSIP